MLGSIYYTAKKLMVNNQYKANSYLNLLLRFDDAYQLKRRLDRSKKSGISSKTTELLTEMSINPDDSELIDKARTMLEDSSVLPLDKYSIYQFILEKTLDKAERCEITRAMYEITKSKIDLFKYGYACFFASRNNEAFEALSKSMPYSALYLARCYRQGIGCDRNERKSFNTLKKGAEAGNLDAVNYLFENEDKYSRYLDESLKCYLLSCRKFGDRARYELLVLIHDMGYVTTSFLKKYTDANEYIYDHVVKFLSDYEIKIIDDTKIESTSILKRIITLLDNKEEYDLTWNPYEETDDYEDFRQVVKKYQIQRDIIEFYESSYGSVPNHAAAECAIFLDIPYVDAAVASAMLNLLLDDQNILNMINKLYIRDAIRKQII